jgi:SCY1-like protein 2
LPIVHIAIESPTHAIVDSALRRLPFILPVLDFSTIKNELFPVIATVFSKTSSLGIKVRGLEAFVVLCGGFSDEPDNDGLDGLSGAVAKKSSSSALDKYTMQEKILPLIRGIKTKEPGVMMAALKVLRQVGVIADTEFLAMDILPVLWTMSLGPLLDLKQFQSFMELIRKLSSRVEQEHTKKLQELAGSAKSPAQNDDFMSFGGVSGFASGNGGGSDNPEDDFEMLVQGKVGHGSRSNPSIDTSWDAAPNAASKVSTKPAAATFSWSTPSPSASPFPPPSTLQPQQAQSRTITPDLSRFDALTPSSTQFSKPLQPQPVTSSYTNPPLQPHVQQTPSSSSINWAMPAQNAWASPAATNPPISSMASLSMNQRPAVTTLSSFSLPPPPISPNNSSLGNAFQIPQHNIQQSYGFPPSQQAQQAPKKGLDAFESLL